MLNFDYTNLFYKINKPISHRPTCFAMILHPFIDVYIEHVENNYPISLHLILKFNREKILNQCKKKLFMTLLT